MKANPITILAAIAGLLVCARASQVKSPQNQQGVTLTNLRPEARLALAPAIVERPLPILELPVTRVVNKQLTPFAIFVYLEWSNGGTGAEGRQKLLIGNFGVFPPDHPGRYVLRASRAFNALRRRGVDLRESRPALLFVMKKVRETEAWTPIEVTISPVRWLAEDESRSSPQIDSPRRPALRLAGFPTAITRSALYW